ncbi:CzcN domain protein [Sulfitobacter geojensis]|nr:CzcN domain protein [Sulfitobacter geojensis]
MLLLCGFIIAFWATGALGWSNAFGSKEGLRTDGIFAYSRNPIYIATWFGLAGWALLVPTPFIVATLCFWALLYLVAIFLEERWLLEEYGEPFTEFCNTVRRFF